MSLIMSADLRNRLNKVLEEYSTDLDLKIKFLRVKHPFGKFGNSEIILQVLLCKDDETIFRFPETTVWEADTLQIRGLKFKNDTTIEES